jgi:hypothetical protein
VHQLKEVSPRENVAGRAGMAEWVALGAVISGSVGALVGAARCATRASRQHRPRVSEGLDPSTVTAPHGDKLEVAR